ncbi:MAG: hypothetical protein JSU70_20530, partial [Phycisphaerales bacterium]
MKNSGSGARLRSQAMSRSKQWRWLREAGPGAASGKSWRLRPHYAESNHYLTGLLEVNSQTNG